MKKLKLVGILAAVVLIGSVISIPLINNHTAYKVEKALCEIPLPEETELIESLSQAGKLTGNGNGMQYFGAILIRSEFDKQGRILVPASLRKYADLQKDVVLTGMDTRIELWSAEKWDVESDLDDEDMEAVAAHMASLGVKI